MAYLERAVRIRQQANFVPVHRIHHLLIRIMRHTPNKRLDGIVAEAPMVYEAGKTR